MVEANTTRRVRVGDASIEHHQSTTTTGRRIHGQTDPSSIRPWIQRHHLLYTPKDLAPRGPVRGSHDEATHALTDGACSLTGGTTTTSTPCSGPEVASSKSRNFADLQESSVTSSEKMGGDEDHGRRGRAFAAAQVTEPASRGPAPLGLGGRQRQLLPSSANQSGRAKMKESTNARPPGMALLRRPPPPMAPSPTSMPTAHVGHTPTGKVG